MSGVRRESGRRWAGRRDAGTCVGAGGAVLSTLPGGGYAGVMPSATRQGVGRGCVGVACVRQLK